jgi:hypothetical protein
VLQINAFNAKGASPLIEIVIESLSTFKKQSVAIWYKKGKTSFLPFFISSQR